MTNRPHEVNDARPNVLEHFIGQDRVVRQIKIALEAAWTDGTRLPHMLFVGGAGLGKTQLAEVVAREMGGCFIEQLGQNLVSPQAVKGFLLEAGDKDVLLLDEVHQLAPAAQVLLYRALEEGRLFLPPTFMKPSRTKAINLERFTLIAATTDQYTLLPPLLHRFKIISHFQKYEPANLTKLLEHRCQRLGWRTSEGVLEQISLRGRGTPRRTLTLLESVHRYSRSEGADVMTNEHFMEACDLAGIDDAGLDELEQQYLRLLDTEQRPMRLNVLAARIGLPVRTIQMNVEESLIADGFIEKCENGSRQLTTFGSKHIQCDYQNDRNKVRAVSSPPDDLDML